MAYRGNRSDDMWCDNCLLIFPLRMGAMALAVFIAAYNVAGAVFLFRDGNFLFFHYPEWQVFGGIGIGVAVMCFLTAVGLSNSSWMWTRLTFFLWPAILLVVAVRAGVMIFELNYYQDRIIWECNHGGQQWTTDSFNSTNTTMIGTLTNSTSTSTATIPSGLCSTGFHSVYIAFVLSFVVDLGLQIYLYFLNWRFLNRIKHYMSFKFDSGVYEP